MKKIMFYLVLLSLMAGCKKTPTLSVDCRSPTNNLTVCRELIIGKWNLVKLVRSIDTSAVITPTNGHSASLIFLNNGTIEYYQDEKYIARDSYDIAIMKKFTKDKADTLRNVLWTKKDRMIVPLKICDDSLYLPYESFAYHIGDFFYVRQK
jgi:hypothetical protein